MDVNYVGSINWRLCYLIHIYIRNNVQGQWYIRLVFWWARRAIELSLKLFGRFQSKSKRVHQIDDIDSLKLRGFVVAIQKGQWAIATDRSNFLLAAQGQSFGALRTNSLLPWLSYYRMNLMSLNVSGSLKYGVGQRCLVRLVWWTSVKTKGPDAFTDAQRRWNTFCPTGLVAL